MITELPIAKEYYRLTRARELREKAARLETSATAWVGRLMTGALTAAAAQFFLGGLETAYSLACLVFPLVLITVPVYALTRDRVTGMKDEALRLEAEHQARHGELPAGEGS
jgi:4-hydroxybenzoate polyprenyltransferase